VISASSRIILPLSAPNTQPKKRKEEKGREERGKKGVSPYIIVL
jgi:hypothetical protein